MPYSVTANCCRVLSFSVQDRNKGNPDILWSLTKALVVTRNVKNSTLEVAFRVMVNLSINVLTSLYVVITRTMAV